MMVFTATSSAQAPKSVSEGVYTADQAKRGEAVYKEQCAACHGDNLEGSGPMPALAGPDFAKAWKGKTVADLFDKTHSSMPATAPGSLTEKQTADVLAYMFSMAKFPAGIDRAWPRRGAAEGDLARREVDFTGAGPIGPALRAIGPWLRDCVRVVARFPRFRYDP